MSSTQRGQLADADWMLGKWWVTNLSPTGWVHNLDPKHNDIVRLRKNINNRDDLNKDEKWTGF